MQRAIRVGLVLLVGATLSSGPVIASPITSPAGLNPAKTVIDFEAYTLGTLGPISNSGATISSSISAAVASSLGYTQYPGIVTGNIFGFNANVSFFIDFAQPVSEFGMGVFDVNFPGTYPGYGTVTVFNTLRALDAGNNVLESINSGTADFPVGPPGGTFSTFVGFARASNDIKRIELIGAAGDLLGIDNVSFYRSLNGSVPEPGTLALLAAALIGLASYRRTRP